MYSFAFLTKRYRCIYKQIASKQTEVLPTWLAYKEANVISKDWCAAIKKVTGQLYNHWQLR